MVEFCQIMYDFKAPLYNNYSNNIIEYEEERMVWELELSTWCCFNSFDFDQKFVYLYFVFCEYNENNK